MQSSWSVTNLSMLLHIWDMWARSGASFVISERPYNLGVDLLLKLVGRGACHMFSIHKYWLWVSCRPSLTLVGFHFGNNLYEMCPIYPQSLSCTMCTCSAWACSRASAVKHMWVDDEVFTGFQIKKTALLERWIRGESKQQIGSWIWSYISEDNLIVCMLVCAGSKQRNAGSASSQVAVNSRWKANSWICSVISGLRLPPRLLECTWWQEQAAPSTCSTTCIPDTHTAHILYSGMQRNEHVQGDNRTMCYSLPLVVKRQNTSNLHLLQITSNILLWTDSFYFNCKRYVFHIVLP